MGYGTKLTTNPSLPSGHAAPQASLGIFLRLEGRDTRFQSSQALPDNKEDDKLYSHMQPKVMSADMLFDSLRLVLGQEAADRNKKDNDGKKKYGGGPREQFRKFFHADADDDVGVVDDYTHGIPQVLRLMNSAQTNQTAEIIDGLMKAGGPEKVIEGLYLRVLSRKPTDAEVKRLQQFVAGERDQAKGYREVMWVLLNSAEFLFNH